MKRILILDTETNGLDPAVNDVIEVAAVLYSVEHATVIECYSSLVAALGNSAELINRIPDAVLPEANGADDVWRRVASLTAGASAFVAHNAEFDHGFTPDHVRRLLPWVCSKNDLRWPKQTKEAPSLVALALEHDLGVATAHRAMADCDLLARLFTRARELGADLPAMLARGMRPKATFAALVSYDDRKLASDAGFKWNQLGLEKLWTRRMAIEDTTALPFKTRQVAS